MRGGQFHAPARPIDSSRPMGGATYTIVVGGALVAAPPSPRSWTLKTTNSLCIHPFTVNTYILYSKRAFRPVRSLSSYSDQSSIPTGRNGMRRLAENRRRARPKQHLRSTTGTGEMGYRICLSTSCRDGIHSSKGILAPALKMGSRLPTPAFCIPPEAQGPNRPCYKCPPRFNHSPNVRCPKAVAGRGLVRKVAIPFLLTLEPLPYRRLSPVYPFTQPLSPPLHVIQVYWEHVRKDSQHCRLTDVRLLSVYGGKNHSVCRDEDSKGLHTHQVTWHRRLKM